MATFHFYLNKSKIDKTGRIPVYFSICVNSVRIRKAVLNVKVKEADWYEKKERIKPNSKTTLYNSHIEYNQILDKLEERFKMIIQYVLLNNIKITPEYLFSRIEEEDNVTKSKCQFDTIFLKFIELKKIDSAKRTIMGFTTCYNKLREFQTLKGKELSLEDINLVFFDEFKRYLFVDKSYSDNYFAKLVANLKTFMKWSSDRNYVHQNEFEKFIATEKPKEIIALFQDELMQLYNLQYKNKRLEQVRDLFCFGCFTGLRFSDLRTLSIEHIGKESISKMCFKTKDKLNIPINRYAREILNKYKDYPYGILPIISEQKFNKHLKSCCKEAGISKPTLVSKFVAGKCIEEVKPKYELITSHVARKTFTTLSLMLGMNETTVKQITNHKRDSNFRKYIKFSEEHNKQEMDLAWNKL